ncbi:uncharacterized protein [Coffea arabica]|uniref:Remorin C-terminal domain-containing protein n=1 Tax=Coffea arabica TaxID=13443 RepID=A0A6P6XE33_COFAR|nr:uncharacterized protein LOC113742005 isoform X1 [Coffea arabica]
MDLKGPKYYEDPPVFPAQQEATLVEGNNFFYSTGTENPFLDHAIHEPLCRLNLKETSDFVKSFPMSSNGAESRGFLDVPAQKRRDLGLSSFSKRNNADAPPTPGRPIFSFSVGNLSRKSFPSKWEDAEKWLISGSSCHDSPAHYHGSRPPLHQFCSSKMSKHCSNEFKPQQAQPEPELFAEKSRVIIDEKVSTVVTKAGLQGLLPPFGHHNSSAGAFSEGSASAAAADVLLKDKFTNEADPIFPSFKCSEPMKEGFLFGSAAGKSTKDAATEAVKNEVKHRDIGTEMTPLGSSTTSRCHTPFKSTSPVRHNTPADRSGPLVLSNSSSTTTIDITQLQECHLAKLQFGTAPFDSVTSNWSSREEEEEEISKSLRHFDLTNDCRKSLSESKAYAWEEEEKTKCCIRYQREEAKIQAWVNLQRAKAEAQSRKLEMKVEKMRSNLEEKLMKKMAIVHRKAEEWRTASRLQHSEQIQNANEQARKITNRQTSYITRNNSCGCFPCNNHHI